MGLTANHYRKVLDVIDIVYTVRRRDDMLRAVFEKLDKLVGFSSAAYVPWDVKSQAFQFEGNVVLNASAKTLATYLEHYSSCDPFLETQSHLGIALNQAVKITDYMAVSRYAETQYARELAPLIPCFYEMNAMLSYQGVLIGGVALHRTRSAGDFIERDREIVSLIAPRLASALHQIGSREDGLSTAISSDPYALLQNDEDNNKMLNGKASALSSMEKSIESGLALSVQDLGLTQRQQEIVLLAVRGLSNREIAGRLFVCEQTIKDHLYDVYLRLHVKKRSELVARIFHLQDMKV